MTIENLDKNLIQKPNFNLMSKVLGVWKDQNRKFFRRKFD